MMSPTENEELMAKPGTGLSRVPKALILAPFPITWDVPGTDVTSEDATSLLGFLSAMSASTLKGKIETLGFPVSSAGPRLVCMSPLLTRTERGGRSSLFKPAIKADMAADGAIQVWLARGRRLVDYRCYSGKSYTKFTQGTLWSGYPHVYVTELECRAIIRQAWRERRPIRDEMGLSLRNSEKKRVGKLTIGT